MFFTSILLISLYLCSCTCCSLSLYIYIHLCTYIHIYICICIQMTQLTWCIPCIPCAGLVQGVFGMKHASWAHAPCSGGPRPCPSRHPGGGPPPGPAHYAALLRPSLLAPSTEIALSGLLSTHVFWQGVFVHVFPNQARVAHRM